MLGTGSINAGKSEMLRFAMLYYGRLVLYCVENLMLSQQSCCHTVEL